MENDPDRSTHDPYRPLKIAGTTALILWIGNLAFGLVTTACGDFGAKLGDSFGAVNSLFSSAAVAGAIYAVVLQREEQAEAREQFKRSEKANEEAARIQRLSAYAHCLASSLSSYESKEANARTEMYRSFEEANKLTSQNPLAEEIDDLREGVLSTISENIELQQKAMNHWSEMGHALRIELARVMAELKELNPSSSETPHPPESGPEEPPSP